MLVNRFIIIKLLMNRDPNGKTKGKVPFPIRSHVFV